MRWCKKDVTSLLTHWSYIIIALTHRFYIWTDQKFLRNLWLFSNNHFPHWVGQWQPAPRPWNLLSNGTRKNILLVWRRFVAVLAYTNNKIYEWCIWLFIISYILNGISVCAQYNTHRNWSRCFMVLNQLDSWNLRLKDKISTISLQFNSPL